VHDYQLLLLPELLRRRLPRARIGLFLHIPFPSSEVFRTLPRRGSESRPAPSSHDARCSAARAGRA
jgi:hypothetical protein